MPRPAEVIAQVRAALRPGGRFVAELGGACNIDAILEAFGVATAEAGLPTPPNPWYFPTPGRYATLLEAGGFRVARMEHFARPTPLEGGDHALADWLAMFGRSLTTAVPPDLLLQVVERTSELAAPRLRHNGRWVADYWRLRFTALAAPDPAGTAPSANTPGAAKLQRQMNGQGGV
jgi:hypothetical protein